MNPTDHAVGAFDTFEDERDVLAFELLLKTGVALARDGDAGMGRLAPWQRPDCDGAGAEATFEVPQQNRQGPDGALGENPRSPAGLVEDEEHRTAAGIRHEGREGRPPFLPGMP